MDRFKYGCHWSDIFKDFIHGRKNFSEYIMHNFHPQIRDLGTDIFPYFNNLQETPYFKIRSQIPQKELIEKHLFSSYEPIFSKRALDDIISDLLLYGKHYIAVSWEENEETEVILPSFPGTPHPTTVHKSLYGKFVQRYSWIAYFFDIRFHRDPFTKATPPRKTIFNKEDILSFKYPFHEKYPLFLAQKCNIGFTKSMKNNLLRAELSVEPWKKTFRGELARSSNFDDERRKYALSQAKVTKTFQMPIDYWEKKLSTNRDLKTTKYYSAYLWYTYAKHLNSFREYIGKEIENQIIKQFKEKNKIDVTSEIEILRVVGLSDFEYDILWERYLKRELSYIDFLNSIYTGMRKYSFS